MGKVKLSDHQRIVWLASYPKSGNTWVRLMLDAYLMGSVDINDLVCSVSDDAAARAAIGDGSKIYELPIDIQQLARPMSLLRLVRAFDENKFADVPLFVKSHSANMAANGMELLPVSLTKCVVHIVRDPRDVLPSYAKHMGATFDDALTMMCDKYRSLTPDEARIADFTSSWVMHTQSYLADTERDVLTIKYEDMRANPAGVFTQILVHSGIEPDADRVRMAVELTELGRIREQEKKAGFLESSPNAKNEFFGKGRVGGWREKLTPKQRHTIEKAFGRTMKRLGYLSNAKAA